MALEANTSTLSLNLNVSPFYDDFDESKNYYRILFRPGLAVQARELTQIQTTLQNQIDRFAEHVFREGSIVRGCQISVDPKISYVKLRDNANNGTTVSISTLSGKTMKGLTSGVKAIVLAVDGGAEANTPNFKSIFVKYVSANTNGNRFFSNNEVLIATDGSSVTANTITSSQGGATGYGVMIKVAAGNIFAKDHFIRVPEQEIIAEKYSSNTEFLVGLDLVESIVDESNDSTLLDPASGSYNFAAPGAKRLKIAANLVKKELNVQTANNFVELARIRNGQILSRYDSTQYSQIRDYLAQRTHDESGDYVIRGYSVQLREHLYSSNNGGVFSVSGGGSANKLAVEVQPGKAYVRGYDIENLGSEIASIDKGIDFESIEQSKTLVDYGNYVIVDNVVGNWDLNQQGLVSLRRQQANAVSTINYSLTPFPATEIGTARVRGVQLATGTPGSASAQYKLYLTDIRMTGGSFANVQSICFNAGAGQANGKADIIRSNGYNANTIDPSFDVAIYKLPSRFTRRLRDTNGNVDTDFKFYKSFDVTFNLAGSATLTTGDSTETFDGSGALSSTAIRGDYYVVSRGSANTLPFAGSVSVVSGGNTVSGVATSFTTQINPGDVLRIPQGANNNLFVVSEVTSPTSLRTLGSFTSTRTNVKMTKQFRPGQVLDLGGFGRNGARGITVSGTPSTTATLNLNETLNANSSSTLAATVIVHLNKIDGQEATKTINRNRLVQLNIGNGGGTSYVANTTGPWPLGVSDGFRLVSVRRKSGSNFASTTEGTDVTSNFTLDNGQRDNLYDHARLVRKSGSGLTLSTNDRLLVTLDNFSHSNRQRGYFSVDSYPVDDTNAGTDPTKIFTYEIPIFVSPVDNSSFDLRDCIDMRPRVADTANNVTTITGVSTNPLNTQTFESASGGLHFSPPQEDFTSDLDYYLSRKDTVCLTKAGGIQVVRGVPSKNAVPPETPDNVMAIAKLNIAPYPSIPQSLARKTGRYDLSCTVTPIRNERYTMRDIGAIRDRVENLEYYTSLNLLEKSTKDLTITDANGLDRFKNGLIVDGFRGHDIGDVYDPDYKISIDTQKNEARPPFLVDNIELFNHQSESTNVVRTNVTGAGVSRDQVLFIANSQVKFANGETISTGGATATLRFQVDDKLYVENASGNFTAFATIAGGSSGRNATLTSVTRTTPGDLVTLPYTHEILVEQPFATTTRNAAGLFYNWLGTVLLDPPTDYWIDTTIRPDVQVNIDFGLDNWANSQAPFTTQWNDWQTVWTGTPQVSADTIFQDNWLINRQLTTTPLGQERTGVARAWGTTPITQNLGSRIVDANIQPFMRSRVIRFTAAGMKPNTRIYPFFDNINVTAYVTPANSSFGNTASEGGILTTDSTGSAYGYFRIPSNERVRFRTGDRVFRLTDSSTNSLTTGAVVTSAQAVYNAQGLNTVQQGTVLSTRRLDIVSRTVSESRTITSTTAAITGMTWVEPSPPSGGGDGGGSDGRGDGPGDTGDDPIAQSFITNIFEKFRVATNGAYLTKVDLFFATKDPVLPVIIDIREIDATTGYLTNRSIPLSRTVVPSSQVNVSDDGSKPTPIYFSSPIHLMNGASYAIVVTPGGTNPNYRLYTARLGENDLLIGNRISQQPAVGMLYASSNDRTWSSVQEEDMKFRLYIAKFDKSATGSAILKNETRDFAIVTDQTAALRNVGEIVHGETLLVGTFANTKLLSVANGTTFAQGMVSGATGTLTRFSANQLRIRNVSLNAKFRGGEAIRIRTNNPTTGGIVGNSSGGITSATYPTGTVAYYDAASTANTQLHIANTGFANSGPASNLNRMFMANTYVRGQTNGYSARIASFRTIITDAINFSPDVLLPSNTSIGVYAKMATSTSARDANYFRIESGTNTFLPSARYVLSRSIESNTAASSSVFAQGRSLEIKVNLTSNNVFGSPALDLKRTGLILVDNQINSNTAIGSSEENVARGGNALARYITRRVTLADGQDAEDLRVYLTAYRPTGSRIAVYYKVLNSEDSDTFDTSRWILMNQNESEGFTSAAAYSSSENLNDFKELVFDVPTYTNLARSGANTVNSGILEYRNSAGIRFTGFKYFCIKVVLMSGDTTNPPRIKDFRAIALQR